MYPINLVYLKFLLLQLFVSSHQLFFAFFWNKHFSAKNVMERNIYLNYPRRRINLTWNLFLIPPCIISMYKWLMMLYQYRSNNHIAQIISDREWRREFNIQLINKGALLGQIICFGPVVIVDWRGVLFTCLRTWYLWGSPL